MHDTLNIACLKIFDLATFKACRIRFYSVQNVNFQKNYQLFLNNKCVAK